MQKPMLAGWRSNLSAVLLIEALTFLALLCISPFAHAATLSLSANPVSVTSGTPSTITWSSSEATSCAASGAWSGIRAISGSRSVIAPNGLNTYVLNCSGPSGNASGSVVIGAGTPAPALYALNVTLSGSGTVTSNPSGIACGANCSANYPSGASVELIPTPAAGNTFTGWSGACSGTSVATTVRLSGNATCTATFSPDVDISGRVVVSQDTAVPVAGARIVDRQTNAVLAITDAAGNFQIDRSSTPAAPVLNVSISADGYLTRETGLQPGTQGVVADIIKLSSPFSLQYYRQLVRPVSDGSDLKPGFALGGWRAETMNVYIRTNLIDPTDRTRPPIDTGVAVSQEAINRVLAGLEKTVVEIAGGTVRISLVESGPEAAHVSQPGWLAIDFFDALNHPQPDYNGLGGTDMNGSAIVRLGLGISSVSPIPGEIPVSDCGPLPLPQGLHQGFAMHELGHVFGLLHAELDSPNLMLRAGATMPCADAHFSPAERLHGRIAFSRPRGNEDPDRDPVGFVLPGVRR